MKKHAFLWIALVLMFVTAAAIAGCNLKGKDDAGAKRDAPTLSEGPAQAPPQVAASQGYSDVAEKAVRSVVNIASTKVVKMRQDTPFSNDPFFRYFFGERMPREVPRERRERALGSGVIVSADGYILTNNHVVEDADEVLILFDDGRELPAKIIGTDSKSDLAVIKVEATDLAPITLGKSEDLRLGEIVLAIGNPFGLSHTVTMGIVSAMGRANVGILDYEDFIQTDAAINPGNSGGALINTRGELVGINTAIFSRSGGYQGIGFAIPVDMAKLVMDSLVKYGRVDRGYLGVYIQDLKPEMRDQFHLETTAGALVADVVKDGPADKAGLKRGDVVLAVDDAEVHDAAHFRNVISQTPVGQEVELTVIRDSNEQKIKVTLGRSPDEEEPTAEPAADETREETKSHAFSGLTVANLNPNLRQRFRLGRSTHGVVVVNVDQGSAAEEAGLRPGDLVLEINREPVKTVRDVKEIVTANDEDKIMLLVDREGTTTFLLLRLK